MSGGLLKALLLWGPCPRELSELPHHTYTAQGTKLCVWLRDPQLGAALWSPTRPRML